MPVSKAEDYVPIPGIFKKELTKDYDGYVANYKITVNEAKLDLTGGEPGAVFLGLPLCAGETAPFYSRQLRNKKDGRVAKYGKVMQ